MIILNMFTDAPWKSRSAKDRPPIPASFLGGVKAASRSSTLSSASSLSSQAAGSLQKTSATSNSTSVSQSSAFLATEKTISSKAVSTSKDVSVVTKAPTSANLSPSASLINTSWSSSSSSSSSSSLLPTTTTSATTVAKTSVSREWDNSRKKYNHLGILDPRRQDKQSEKNLDKNEGISKTDTKDASKVSVSHHHPHQSSHKLDSVSDMTREAWRTQSNTPAKIREPLTNKSCDKRSLTVSSSESDLRKTDSNDAHSNSVKDDRRRSSGYLLASRIEGRSKYDILACHVDTTPSQTELSANKTKLLIADNVLPSKCYDQPKEKSSSSFRSMDNKVTLNGKDTNEKKNQSLTNKDSSYLTSSTSSRRKYHNDLEVNVKLRRLADVISDELSNKDISNMKSPVTSKKDGRSDLQVKQKVSQFTGVNIEGLAKKNVPILSSSVACKFENQGDPEVKAKVNKDVEVSGDTSVENTEQKHGVISLLYGYSFSPPRSDLSTDASELLNLKTTPAISHHSDASQNSDDAVTSACDNDIISPACRHGSKSLNLLVSSTPPVIQCLTSFSQSAMTSGISVTSSDTVTSAIAMTHSATMTSAVPMTTLTSGLITTSPTMTSNVPMTSDITMTSDIPLSSHSHESDTTNYLTPRLNKHNHSNIDHNSNITLHTLYSKNASRSKPFISSINSMKRDDNSTQTHEKIYQHHVQTVHDSSKKKDVLIEDFSSVDENDVCMRTKETNIDVCENHAVIEEADKCREERNIRHAHYPTVSHSDRITKHGVVSGNSGNTCQKETNVRSENGDGVFTSLPGSRDGVKTYFTSDSRGDIKTHFTCDSFVVSSVGSVPCEVSTNTAVSHKMNGSGSSETHTNKERSILLQNNNLDRGACLDESSPEERTHTCNFWKKYKNSSEKKTANEFSETVGDLLETEQCAAGDTTERKSYKGGRFNSASSKPLENLTQREDSNHLSSASTHRNFGKTFRKNLTSSEGSVEAKPPTGRSASTPKEKMKITVSTSASIVGVTSSSTMPVYTTSPADSRLTFVGHFSQRPSDRLLASLKKDFDASKIHQGVKDDSETLNSGTSDSALLLNNLQTTKMRTPGKRSTSDLGLTPVAKSKSEKSPRTAVLLQNAKLRQHLANTLNLDPKQPDFVGTVRGKLRNSSLTSDTDVDSDSNTNSSKSLSPSESFLTRRRQSDSGTSISLDFQLKARESASKFHVPSFKEYIQSRKQGLDKGSRMCSSHEFIREVVDDEEITTSVMNSTTDSQDKNGSQSGNSDLQRNMKNSASMTNLIVKPPKPEKHQKRQIHKSKSYNDQLSDSHSQHENNDKLIVENNEKSCNSREASDWPDDDVFINGDADSKDVTGVTLYTEEDVSESSSSALTQPDYKLVLEAPPGFGSSPDVGRRRKSSRKKSSSKKRSTTHAVLPPSGFDEGFAVTDEDSISSEQSRKKHRNKGKSQNRKKITKKMKQKQSESSSLDGDTSGPSFSEVTCQDCQSTLLAPPTGEVAMETASLCTRCQQKRRDRREAIQELVSTEISYGKDLLLIKNEFEQPMLTTSMISKEHCEALFGNIDELIAINQQFVRQIQTSLEQATAGGDEDYLWVSMGRPFLEASTMLLAFETYCVSQSTAPTLLESLINEKKLLKLFLEVASKENPVLRRMDLKSFLMVPVQRVMKYPLLLSRIAKATSSKQEDYGLLKKAKSRVEEILEHINSQTKGSASLKKRRMSWVMLAKRAATAENIEISRLALEQLGWSRHQAYFIHTARLFYSLPPDSSWHQRQNPMKFSETQAVLISLGRNPGLDQESGKKLLFPRHSCVEDVALVLFKEKAGRFHSVREPLHLSQCVVSMDASVQVQHLFEIHEMQKDPYWLKGENNEETLLWYEKLRLHSKDQGRWRRRRGAMSNIMMLTAASTS